MCNFAIIRAAAECLAAIRCTTRRMLSSDPSTSPRKRTSPPRSPSAIAMALRTFAAQQFEGVFVIPVQERIGALVVADETVFVGGREQLVALAARFGVPAIYPFREFIVAGGLVS
jgi:hypothetical protein